MLPKNKVQSSTSHTTNDTNRTISPERIAKMERILSTRQPTLSMFLEDVHNPHNASAVMRSCDAVGLYDMYYTHQHPQGKEKYHINQGIAMGTRKRTSFVEVDDSHVFFEQQKKEGKQIIVTSLQEKSVDFRSIDYTKPTLIVMGNEVHGVSDQVIHMATACVTIPMLGMAQSLNISVAAAVLLYEIQRQRELAHMYKKPQISSVEYEQTLSQWIQREKDRKIIKS